jgi:hypothetical protein
MLKVWGRRSSKVLWLIGELELAHAHVMIPFEELRGIIENVLSRVPDAAQRLFDGAPQSRGTPSRMTVLHLASSAFTSPWRARRR